MRKGIVDYKDLLEHSFEVEKTWDWCSPESRIAYLSAYIFDFTTYDSEMDELFAAKAVGVCKAINDRTTFEYIKEPEQYKWYLLMCNMPFFAKRIEWGTSIRGAWWGARQGRQMELHSCGLWMNGEQLTDTMEFSDDEWKEFIAAVIEFAAPEMKPNMK